MESRTKHRTEALSLAGVRRHDLKVISDARGDLAVAELPADVPFLPKRYFLVFNVPSKKETRGEHAHKQCIQYLTCIAGSCTIAIDDGASRHEVTLDSPGMGVLVPPMIWCSQYNYSPDAVLLVLASESYDAADYIRDYDEFKRLKAHPA